METYFLYSNTPTTSRSLNILILPLFFTKSDFEAPLPSYFLSASSYIEARLYNNMMADLQKYFASETGPQKYF